VLSLGILTRRSLAQTLHDRNAQAGLGHGFGNDQLEARFIKATQSAVEVCGCLVEILLATQILDSCKSYSGL
jgi:hypothetical protein